MRQDDPGRIDGVQIAGAQQPLLAGQIKDALGVGVGEHGEEYVSLIRPKHYLDEKKDQPRAAVFGSVFGDRTADRRRPNQRGIARRRPVFPRMHSSVINLPTTRLTAWQAGFL